MERADTDGGLGLQPIGDPAQAARSRRRSAASSSDDLGKEDTKTAERSQPDLEIELSILQSNYEKCLNFGLRARIVESMTIDGLTPVLTIQMLDVSRCPTCNNWIPGQACPMC